MPRVGRHGSLTPSIGHPREIVLPWSRDAGGGDRPSPAEDLREGSQRFSGGRPARSFVPLKDRYEKARGSGVQVAQAPDRVRGARPSRRGPGAGIRPVLALVGAAITAALLVHVPVSSSSFAVFAPQDGGSSQGHPLSRKNGGGIAVPSAWADLALAWVLPGWYAPQRLVLGPSSGEKAARTSPSFPTFAFPPGAEHPPNARPPDPTVPPPDVYGTDPQVGIYHTGTTEAYAPALVAAGKPWARYSLDQAVTVVQVGAVLCQSLGRLGVGCVHSRAINDPDGMLGAYETSAKTARAMLRAYPTLRVLLDVHRLDVAGSGTAPVTGAGTGNQAAPLTLVVGTDDLLPEPHWRKNLAFARVLQAAARRLYPAWPFHVEVSPNQYNQELSPGALLVEVGDVETPLRSADTAAVQLAHVLRAVVANGLAPHGP